MGLTRTFLVWALLRVAVEAQVPPPKEPKKVFSMAESIEAMQRTLLDPELEKIRKEYWKKTFNDIRNLTGYNLRPSDSGGILSQWKLLQEEARAESGTYSLAVPKGTSTLSDNAENISTVLRQQEWIRSPPRFEGFPSWERKLLDWSEEIQEYLDRASEDSESGYQFGDYGRPPIKAVPENTVTNGESNKTVSFVEPPTKLKEISISPDDTEKDPIVKPVTGRKPMPIPAPAKPGEEVLPHTDIADKSKRLLIVTTAALPWKTGTAVNPLLRAAYLTKGRKEAGGNVTLMLPWLERQEDQYRVYGANNTFETPADQEQYIRTWLKESADMKQASVDLKIQWYTAWQNKVENSIYSMGDITALVSADDVDICILEEPEHLNWYALRSDCGYHCLPCYAMPFRLTQCRFLLFQVSSTRRELDEEIQTRRRCFAHKLFFVRP